MHGRGSVTTSAPEEVPRVLPYRATKVLDPTGMREVSGGDLSEEPCKHTEGAKPRPSWHMSAAEAPGS